jgi:hypothetical protein
MTPNNKDERGKQRRDVKMEFIINRVPPEPVKKISAAQQSNSISSPKQTSISLLAESG